MYCEKCGEPMQWRATNTVTQMAKYKCPICGNVQTELFEKKPEYHYEPNYYFYRNGAYIVKKTTDGEPCYVGTFRTEELARKVVAKMKEYDWKPDMIPQCFADLGIHKVGRSWSI